MLEETAFPYLLQHALPLLYSLFLIILSEFTSVAPLEWKKMHSRLVCARFWGGTERRDAKVGSLPHGCVHCLETSVYPPAESASRH